MHLLPFSRVALFFLFATLGAAAAANDQRATPEQAVAMVKRAVAFIQEKGPEKAYPVISDKKGGFVVGDLYITVWGLNGVVRAHGANRNMIGRNLYDLRDIDGKLFIEERMKLASAKGKFWQDYKFTHPTTGKIEPKRMYCESLNDSVVCGGVYKYPS